MTLLKQNKAVIILNTITLLLVYIAIYLHQTNSCYLIQLVKTTDSFFCGIRVNGNDRVS